MLKRKEKNRKQKPKNLDLNFQWYHYHRAFLTAIVHKCGSRSKGAHFFFPHCFCIVKTGKSIKLQPAAASAAHHVPLYGRNSEDTAPPEVLRQVYAAVVIQRPTLVDMRVVVCIIPPAMDCWFLGSDDIRYILVTVNWKSAPITDRQSDGKINAQYTLCSGIAQPQYTRAPMAINSLLLTLCMMKPAITFRSMLAIAIGSIGPATASGERCCTS
jgi:hypothetical protein